jgi:glycosyltransferase involved in cell wall biosynthesis
MPIAIEKYDLEKFDVVLSSSSAFAKGVLTSPNTLHISYCHTPARYLWSDAHHYIADLPYNRVIKTILPRFISKLRLWDKMSADRVDDFIANSKTVQYRIQKYYRRVATVIHPPVDMSTFSVSSDVGDYFITGGRLVPYKSTDLVIQVFNRLQLPLRIFGTGPELQHLQKIAKPNISFLGRISDQEKAVQLAHAQAFIHPQMEDFGITALESMSSGRPVIAFASGGATETVVPNETGIFFYEQTWEARLDTVLNFNKLAWDSTKIRDHASLFDVENFKHKIQEHVDHHYEEFKRGLEQPLLIRL